MGCVFCEIVSGSLNCEKIYEDDYVLAFKDLEPQAPVHFLVIPKKHYENFEQVAEKELQIFEKIFKAIQHIAKKLGLDEGMRIVNNCKEKAGQTVNHLHFHVLSGRKMTWPPG